MSKSATLTVSQEFFLAENIKTNLSQFVGELKDYLKEDATQQAGMAKNLKARHTLKAMGRVAYTDLRDTKIFVPAGMSVQYIDYLARLEEAVKIAEGLQEKVVKPFSRWLAVGIANPDTFKNVRGSNGLRDFEPHNIDGVAMNLGGAFTKGSNVNEVAFKNGFARNADYAAVVSKANDLNERFLKTDHKAIMNLVGQISEYLEIVTKRIDDDEENYELSPVSIELLSKLSFTLAQEVEFYGTVGYQVTATMVALHDTDERLEGYFKKLKV